MIVPLDWGLGHATRCIPLIKEFLANDCQVIIAAEGATKSLLQHEFQQLIFLPLKGYRVRYSRNGQWLPLTILTQIPGLILSIVSEHFWVKKVIKKYAIDAIISDNRFGLFNSKLPSIYITHQLVIKTGTRWIENLLQKINHFFISKYQQCWVPDFDGEYNIAGELSHPPDLPQNLSYIGCLSRFDKKNEIQTNLDLLVLISGPEPQRTIFETLLLKELKYFQGSAMVVRGLPGVVESTGRFQNLPSQISVKNHLSSSQLNIIIQQSAMIIARSGYTTVMDLIKLNKKAILVPTPGQTEQEYLAKHLMDQQLFYAVSQQKFNLTQCLQATANFEFLTMIADMEQYKTKIRQFVQTL